MHCRRESQINSAKNSERKEEVGTCLIMPNRQRGQELDQRWWWPSKQNTPKWKNLKSVLLQSKELWRHQFHCSLHPSVVNTYTSIFNTGRVAAATAGCTSASCLGGQRWPAASGGPFCFYEWWSFHAAPPLEWEENRKLEKLEQHFHRILYI